MKYIKEGAGNSKALETKVPCKLDDFKKTYGIECEPEILTENGLKVEIDFDTKRARLNHGAWRYPLLVEMRNEEESMSIQQALKDLEEKYHLKKEKEEKEEKEKEKRRKKDASTRVASK